VKGKVFKAIVLVISIVLVLSAGGCSSNKNEIPWSAETSLPDTIGAPAVAQPTGDNGVPQNPNLALYPYTHAHTDIWMSDTANNAGPLGNNPVTLSTTLPEAHQNPDSWLLPCGNIMIDSQGRLILTCFGVNEASVIMADPETLEVLAWYPLEVTEGAPFGGWNMILPSAYAIYGYLDNLDQVHLVSGSRYLITIAEVGTPSKPEFKQVESFDMGALLTPTDELPDGDAISGVMVDFQGRYWINMRSSANIYLFDPKTAEYPYTDLPQINLGEGEFTRNGLALTEEGAAYIVTTQKMYRVDVDANGNLVKVWEAPYDTIGEVRSGQIELGSGTTPTILGGGKYVAITDNAEQMDVVVYRTEAQLGADEDRVVCKMPVFDFEGGGKGANSNSLNGFQNSIIVQNTYGYLFDFDEANNYANPHLEQPGALGIERIDINPDGKGCTKVWVNKEVATVLVPRLSTSTGLIYTHDRKWDAENEVNAYYWVALDYRTGEVVWEKLAGTGDRFENWWLPPTIGPDGALYGPVYGGITMIKDSP